MWRASCSPSHLLHRLRSISLPMPSTRDVQAGDDNGIGDADGAYD